VKKSSDSTLRFSGRVEQYARYRPSYPESLIDFLVQKYLLGSDSVVADVGSGTGRLTRLLLGRGVKVHAVEPNDGMREEAEKTLSSFSEFQSVNGMAEQTRLADNSVDLITSAQAFHWFDRNKARQEFERLLNNQGWVALIWNQRKIETPFQRDYEHLSITWAEDYGKVNHMNISDEDIDDFFQPYHCITQEFDYLQDFDFEALMGRMLSSSYTPLPASEAFTGLKQAARQLIDHYQRDGQINFEYRCRLFLCQFNGVKKIV
jgi:SAM-dependent methyltransferase